MTVGLDLQMRPERSAQRAADPSTLSDRIPIPGASGHVEPDALMIGIDVGSTTVKAVCVDPADGRIVWQDYQRHETRQAEKVREMLVAIEASFPGLCGERRDRVQLFVTGSGASPLVEPLGARFVQEVNAVTLAVEALHPDAGSVVELGGQDAKIIVFNEHPESGEKQAICSMNDKCASGTGATIDKCLVKVGMPAEEVGRLAFDASTLHKVAAKCGVFAETDIVNLIKAGIPAAQVMCSLADAIVTQNLSVLTRGNTLRPKVLLLGGPNTYLPLLRDAWRLRIPQTWAERGVEPPPGLALDELIVVPDNAQYYAAYGAVVFGVDEPDGVGRYRGLEGLERFITRDRAARLGEAAGPPLIASPTELESFRARYRVPEFSPASFRPGQEVVRAAIGLDGGSTSSKAVLLAEDGEVLAKAYRLSEGNPIEDMKGLLAELRAYVVDQGAHVDVVGFGATGYAARVLEESVRADANVVETVAHMVSALHYFGEVDVICDIGGQDIKVLFMRRGDIKSFRLSNQCSAGNGMLLQSMAEQFGVPLEAYADHAFKAALTPVFSYGCAVFLDTDRVNFQKEGFAREELLAGLAAVLPKNVWQYVVQIPRMAELGTRFVLQGGTQRNLAAVKAQVDYIRKRVPGAVIHVHPHTGEAGAIGAALEALRVVARRGRSTFIGLDQAIALEYETRNDESTRCRFCRNECARTFIDTRAPDGRSSRYIAGFSCERGTVESKAAMLKLVKARKQLKRRFVNLAEYEARLAFRSFYEPAALPKAGTAIDDLEVHVDWLGRVRRRPIRRGFRRSSQAAAARRSAIRIGIPRVLNIYSTAPLWRTYFETLGIPKQNVVFSEPTSEALWKAGAKYGAVDPCFPAKVVQAHIHNLLLKKQARRPLDYLFFPSITHMPTAMVNTMDNAACPIVAGTPSVTRAAFTKEKDYFAEHGVETVFDAATLDEPVLFRRKMFEIWGERLGITEDESDFAMAQAWEALRRFDAEMERRGLEVLEQVEAENRLALLLLSRPYHLDPGLNHGVLEEFQAQGYPILTIRSIPKDRGFLTRWFGQDLDAGRIGDPLDISDVWPENFSTNSVQKVWAAKFAARHPNLAVLDLSSFKCGHDAPTYGLIDSIIKAGRTPYMALHDIDANKPSGSMAIRVRTYTHTLRRAEEALVERAARRSELERRLEVKRRELIAARRRQLAERAARDPNERKALVESEHAFESYLDEDEPVKGMRLDEVEETRDDAETAIPGDVASSPVRVQVISLGRRRSKSLDPHPRERPESVLAAACACSMTDCGGGCGPS